MAQEFGERVMNKLMRILARDGVNNGAKMNQALNLLARYRAREVGAALYTGGGALVRSGPFQGMGFTTEPQKATSRRSCSAAMSRSCMM
jgi:hypothetical protein